MDEIESRARDLMRHGLSCSQIMVLLSQEMRGKNNPDLIRTLAGLGGGMAAERACGTLTGGCCVISSYVSRADVNEEPKMPHKPMVKELVEWFESEFKSIDCKDLVEVDMKKRVEYCPTLIAKTFTKAMEILTNNGVDVYE